MNIKSIFEPIDNIIAQAKKFIQEQEVRNKFIKKIDVKVEEIRPELENRRAEILDLLPQIEMDDKVRDKLNHSLAQLDSYIKYIDLMAEKELALEALQGENKDTDLSKKEQREKYICHQLTRLDEQIKATNNFFEVADFANEIWADFDLFEEFNYAEPIVQSLVDRMNETNAKNTETRMGRDLRKILEHIRMNLVKSTAWTDEEVKDYQSERDLKLKQLQPVKIPEDKNFNVAVIGSDGLLTDKLEELYAIPNRTRVRWVDFNHQEEIENILRAQPRYDLVIFITMLPNHEVFKAIQESLEQDSIPYVEVNAYGTEKLVQTMEDELIRISFEKQFAVR
jgi:hypothetical protein